MIIRKISFLYFAIALFVCTIYSQDQSTTLSGFIFDESSGETLIGANVYITSLGVGTSSNGYGFYSLTVPNGSYKIDISYVGYTKTVIELKMTGSQKQDISLKPSSFNLGEVVVSEKRADENVKSTQMGTRELAPKEIDNVPVLLGEKDILKTIQLMPGVSSAGEGNSGFIVRGGSADQNLVILDEAPVYNPSHLMGFFSVFNSDAIKSAKIIKGNSPPEYGGRLSSVLDINMKDGSNKNYSAYGGIGLISSRLTFEGPISVDKGSFIISGRRTYVDLFFPLFGNDRLANSALYFYDLNMKLNYTLGENDRLFISGYTGRDVFQFNNKFGFDWGNTTGTIRWNHILSDKLFSNTTIIYSDYNYDINIEDNETSAEVKSGIRDINIKEDLQYYINSEHTIKFGLNGIYHTFMPGEITASGLTNFNSLKVANSFALEGNVYLGHEWQISPLFQINYGLRYSNFTLFGPGDVYSFDNQGNVISTDSYGNGDVIKSYNFLEPRFAASYLLDETSSLKVGYARNTQHIHLLSTSTTSTPMDIWQPSSANIEPETSDLISFGYFKNFNNNMFEASLEFYYKDMQNLIEYKNGADIFINQYVESQLVFGHGWSYGMELLVQKKFGNFTGWLGYTLSKTERQFDDINDGEAFPSRQDRTHDISLVGMYNLNEHWAVSANWVYSTGLAATYPSGKYTIDGKIINLYTERNGYRMPDYHRLDLGATYTFNKSDRQEMSLTLSVYNAYGRKNAYTISFEESTVNPNVTEAVKLSLFSVVPSLTFNFRF